MSLRAAIKDFLFGVKVYEGIRSDEPVEIHADYFGRNEAFQVEWGDIVNIYHWMNEPTKENIEKLKFKYKIIDDGYGIKFKIFAKKCTDFGEVEDGRYYEFQLNQVKSFYNQVLEEKIRKEQNELDKKVRKDKELIRNKPEELVKSIEKILKK